MSYQFEGFTTANECEFIRQLVERSPSAFQKYATLVLSGMRNYDAAVNVAKVRDLLIALGGRA